jgi:hypothetical protein
MFEDTKGVIILKNNRRDKKTNNDQQNTSQKLGCTHTYVLKEGSDLKFYYKGDILLSSASIGYALQLQRLPPCTKRAAK